MKGNGSKLSTDQVSPQTAASEPEQQRKSERFAQYIVITTAFLYAGNLVFEIGKQPSATKAGLAGKAAVPSNGTGQ